MASRSIGVNDNNVITFTAIVVGDGMKVVEDLHKQNNSPQSKRFQEAITLLNEASIIEAKLQQTIKDDGRNR